MRNANGKEIKSERAYVDNSAAAKLLRVIVILKDGKIAGKMLVKYPTDGAGNLIVNLYDYTVPDVDAQYGTAGGYGYDKLSAALEGLTFDGHTFPHSGKEYWQHFVEWGYEYGCLL